MWPALAIAIVLLAGAAAWWLERKARKVAPATPADIEGVPREAAGSKWEYALVAFVGVLAGIRIGRVVVRYELNEWAFLAVVAVASAAGLLVLYSFRRTGHLTRSITGAYALAAISGACGVIGYFMSRW